MADELPRRREGAQPRGRATSPADERRDTQVGNLSHESGGSSSPPALSPPLS
jgi:hypothetical protein